MASVFSVQLFKTAYQKSELIALKGPVVVFLGRSNAGKSSLLNALTGGSTAHVSKHPGKTASVNYYRAKGGLTLVDLPGYGYAKKSQDELRRWRELMEAFFDSLPAGAFAYLLQDAKRDWGQTEEDLITSLLQRAHRLVLLLTKADRLTQSERAHGKQHVQKFIFNLGLENLLTFHWVSVKTSEGLSELHRELYRYGQEHRL